MRRLIAVGLLVALGVFPKPALAQSEHRLVQTEDGTLWIVFDSGSRYQITPQQLPGATLSGIFNAAPSESGIIYTPEVSAAAPAPAATAASAAEPVAPVTGQSVTISGRGQTATQTVTPPSVLSLARLQHDGQRNFIVKSIGSGNTDLLVNTIGRYSGSRPISGSGPLMFDIEADGAWTITLETIPPADNAAASGQGDSVSGYFTAPTNGPWEFSHQGSRNYIVRLHCANGTQLMQNRIGSFSGSSVIQFRGSPCFWEVQADGNWAHSPRP